jgi:hypothetical protein
LKTYKKITTRREDKVYCDACGGVCTEDNFGSDYATLEAAWGYNSKSDGLKFEIQLCEDCFYDLLKIIEKKRKKHNVVTKYDPLKGSEYPLI